MRKLMTLCEVAPSPTTIQKKGGHLRTMPTTYIVPQYTNSNPYDQYRYGIAMAVAAAQADGHDVEFNKQSAFNISLTMIAYTEEEERIIELAGKLMGVTPKLITTHGVQEPRTTETSSPVPKQK